MKVLLAFTVHSVQRAMFAIPAKLTDDGTEVEAQVPGVVVELVPAGRHRHSVHLDVLTRTEEATLEALAGYGFGAEVTLELVSVKKGLTPHQMMVAALPSHIVEGEHLVAAAQAAHDALPADAPAETRTAAEELLRQQKTSVIGLHSRLVAHHGKEGAAAVLATAAAKAAS